MSLSTRSRALFKKIMYTQSPLRIKDFANDFQVSERTIKYDLETIRLWLLEQDVEIKLKSSKGISIDCDDSIRIKLLEKLDNGSEQVFLNQQERVRHIILNLLLLDDYITIGDLVKSNDVSRNTIHSDLFIAEKFFNSWELVLERTRFGIKLLGSENQRRYVVENVIQDLLDGNDMFQIVQGVALRKKPPLHFSKILERFLQPVKDLDQIFETVGILVKEMERDVGVLLSDRVIIGVFIRLCIVIQRREQESALQPFDPEKNISAINLSIYRVFRVVLSELSAELGTAISDDGVWFVCLQAIGMVSPFPNHTHFSDELIPDTQIITKSLIEKVSIQTQVQLQEDVELFNHLLAHITDKLTKYSYGVAEPNPLLHEIMSTYRIMFEHVKRACIEVFSTYGMVLTDSDIGFIVLHFQTAYEHRSGLQKFRALVVCGTGRGTSRLLKTVIENEIKNLHVAGSCSVMEIEKVLGSASFDLVISIFPITVNVPLVIVSPIPGKKDFHSIQAQLDVIERIEGSSKELNLTPKLAELTKDSSVLETQFQDIIFKGFELSKLIISTFKERLSDERAEGLTLHLFFMMNRIAFDSKYNRFESAAAGKEPDSEIREQLLDILRSKQVHIPESEIMAILRYFE
jgi:mannitol operon transcriptional antiterminator